MNELTFKTILVDSIADNGKKITLLSGKEKYNFWKTKTDKTETRAYQQYQSMRVSAGNEYPLAVKEEEKSFTNDQGKNITFMDRTVMYFATKEAGQGQVPMSKPTDSSLEARVTKLENELASLKALVSTVTSQDAVDLHTSIAPKSSVNQVAQELGGEVIDDVPF